MNAQWPGDIDAVTFSNGLAGWDNDTSRLNNRTTT